MWLIIIYLSPHMYIMLLLVTHFTSYSLLNLVHEIMCEFGLVIQDYVFYGIWCKICLDWKKLYFWWLKTLFWSSGLKTHVFKKHLNSFSSISFIKLIGLSCFCIIFCNFSKNSNFQNLDRSNVFFDWLKISWFLIIALCLTQLVFDQYSTVWNWKIFSF